MSELKVDGMMKIPSNYEGKNVNVNGMLKVGGDLNTTLLDGDGIVKIKGNISAKSIEMDGVLKVGSKITTDKLEIDGALKAESIEGEEIYVDGKIEINQSINCEKLDITIDSKSSIDSIECASVNVKFKKLINKYLTIDSISADDINISNVKCKSVFGDKVVIGPNCDIQSVEYKTSLEIHESSNVGNKQKIEVK